MTLYSPIISNRLRYISDFIGGIVAGQPFQLTDNREEYARVNGRKINYSEQKINEAEFWIRPHGLLFEKDIKQQSISCDPGKAFFHTEGDLHFDIFSAAFYLLSRYEEYLTHKKDMYGRYAHENSLAFRENFLDQPLVNQWMQSFGRRLKEKFPEFIIHQSLFIFQPTYDIDEAWSFKHKSWWRTTGAGIKDLLKGKAKNYSLRRKVIRGAENDPFDSFDWMDQLHTRFKLQPIYFFLVAEKNSRYDKNILPAEPAMKDLIKRHAGKYPLGIHPSWQSGDERELLNKEIKTLSGITGRNIESSRQHFIRLTLPETFRRLIDAGIRNDYSMGYGSINGFRASVASPFYWYDLEKDHATNLLLHPFCYMEANSFFEQKFTPEQALQEMRHYYKAVKNVGGTMISLWHNTFLGTDPLFKGWREVYEEFLNEVQIS